MREIIRCHLNYVVADTKQWEQSAAYYLDRSPMVDAFVKNSGLGFAVPYLHNGQMHDYVPDFIVRLKTDPIVHVVLETKGYDPLEEVKRAAAERWVAAVNADGTYGEWRYALVKKVSHIHTTLARAAQMSESLNVEYDIRRFGQQPSRGDDSRAVTEVESVRRAVKRATPRDGIRLLSGVVDDLNGAKRIANRLREVAPHPFSGVLQSSVVVRGWDAEEDPHRAPA